MMAKVRLTKPRRGLAMPCDHVASLQTRETCLLFPLPAPLHRCWC